MQYYGNFTVNNGTTMMKCVTNNNKHKLLKDLKEMALSNRFEGNKASWWIRDENDDIVFEAEFTPGTGTRFSVYNYKSMY